MSEVKKRFLHLWRIMAPLYRSLEAKLEQRGLATSSGAYRLALAALREKGREALPYKKVIAVGFNALSMVENAIFQSFRESFLMKASTLSPISIGMPPGRCFPEG